MLFRRQEMTDINFNDKKDIDGAVPPPANTVGLAVPSQYESRPKYKRLFPVTTMENLIHDVVGDVVNAFALEDCEKRFPPWGSTLGLVEPNLSHGAAALEFSWLLVVQIANMGRDHDMGDLVNLRTS